MRAETLGRQAVEIKNESMWGAHAVSVGMPGCDWAYCKARDEKRLVSVEAGDWRLMADGDGWRAMMKGQGRWAPWVAPVPAVRVGSRSSPT